MPAGRFQPGKRLILRCRCRCQDGRAFSRLKFWRGGGFISWLTGFPLIPSGAVKVKGWEPFFVLTGIPHLIVGLRPTRALFVILLRLQGLASLFPVHPRSFHARQAGGGVDFAGTRFFWPKLGPEDHPEPVPGIFPGHRGHLLAGADFQHAGLNRGNRADDHPFPQLGVGGLHFFPDDDH